MNSLPRWLIGLFVVVLILCLALVSVYFVTRGRGERARLEGDQAQSEVKEEGEELPLPEIQEFDPLAPIMVMEQDKGKGARITGTIVKESWLLDDRLRAVELLVSLPQEGEKRISFVLGQDDWMISYALRRNWDKNSEDQPTFQGKLLKEILPYLKEGRVVAFSIDLDEIIELNDSGCLWCSAFGDLYKEKLNVNQQLTVFLEEEKQGEFKDLAGPVVQMEVSQ